MALPSSGQLSFSAIATELGAAGALSLRGMSALAGKSTPDAVSEFYGYSYIQYAYVNYVFTGYDIPNSGDVFVEVYDQNTSTYAYPTPYFFPNGSSYEYDESLTTNLIVGHTYTIINYRENTDTYGNSYVYTNIYNSNITIDYLSYVTSYDMGSYYAQTYVELYIPDTSSILMNFENGPL